MAFVGKICNHVKQRYYLAVMAMFGHLLASMCEESFNLLMREMIYTEKALDKHSCPLDAAPPINSKDFFNNERFKWNNLARFYLLYSYSIGMYLGMVPQGLLTDKYGAKTLMGMSGFVPGLLSILTPICVRSHPYVMIANRMITGFFKAAQYTTTCWFAARWFPLRQQGVMLGVMLMGVPLGMMSSAYLIFFLSKLDYAWTTVYYMIGVFCITWSYFWQASVWEDPFENPYITLGELGLLYDKIPMYANDTGLKPGWVWPWKEILTSKDLWLLNVGHLGYCLFFNFAIVIIPNLYLPEVQHYHLASHQSLYAFVNILMAFAFLTYGFISDQLIKERWLNTTHVVKLFYVFSTIFGSLLMLGTTHSKCNSTTIVLYYMFALGCLGIGYPNWPHACLHMAPNFAGTSMGVSTLLGTIVMPVQFIIEDRFTYPGTENQWQTASYVVTAGSILCTAIFLKWGNCQMRSWNQPKQGKIKNEKHIKPPLPRSTELPKGGDSPEVIGGPQGTGPFEETTTQTTKENELVSKSKSGLFLALAASRSQRERPRWKKEIDPETDEPHWVVDFKGSPSRTQFVAPVTDHESSAGSDVWFVSSEEELSSTSLGRFSKSTGQIGITRWSLETDPETNEEYWVAKLAPESNLSFDNVSKQRSLNNVARSISAIRRPSWRTRNSVPDEEYGIIELTPDGKIPTSKGNVSVTGISMHSLIQVVKPKGIYRLPDQKSESPNIYNRNEEIELSKEIKDQSHKNKLLFSNNSKLAMSPQNDLPTNRLTNPTSVIDEQKRLSRKKKHDSEEKYGAEKLLPGERVQNPKLYRGKTTRSPSNGIPIEQLAKLPSKRDEVKRSTRKKERLKTSDSEEEYGIIELSPEGKVLKVKPKLTHHKTSKSPQSIYVTEPLTKSPQRSSIKKHSVKSVCSEDKHEVRDLTSDLRAPKENQIRPNSKHSNPSPKLSSEPKSERSSRQKKSGSNSNETYDLRKPTPEVIVPKVKRKRSQSPKRQKPPLKVKFHPNLTEVVKSWNQLVVPRGKEGQFKNTDPNKVNEPVKEPTLKKTDHGTKPKPSHSKHLKHPVDIMSEPGRPQSPISKPKRHSENAQVLMEKKVFNDDPKYDEYGIVELPPSAKLVRVKREQPRFQTSQSRSRHEKPDIRNVQRPN